MVIIAPLACWWYDKIGGRWPLVTGFAVLILSGLLLALGTGSNTYLAILPGLLAFGVGLALVLTVNDPVSLDTVPSADHRPRAYPQPPSSSVARSGLPPLIRCSTRPTSAT